MVTSVPTHQTTDNNDATHPGVVIPNARSDCRDVVCCLVSLKFVEEQAPFPYSRLWR